MSNASSNSTISSSAQNSRPAKSTIQSKIVVLKLPAAMLGSFLPKTLPQKIVKGKSSSSNASTPTGNQATTAPTPTSSPTRDASETHATPPASEAADAPTKKGSGAKAGTKRPLGQTADTGPKARPKSAPKKRQRLDDIKNESGKPGTGGLTNGTHKLGPKANQGAINAGLRALDRSGKPCRRWERKPIQLKSFTGVVWELPSWRAPKPKPTNEENSDEKDASQQSASKANDSSIAVESERSNAGENGVEPVVESTPAASSPAPDPAPAPAPTSVAVAATG